MAEIAARFLIGGLIVSAFSIVGTLFKPKSFAGLFGAAPSVALASLTLTIRKSGPSQASVDARSMLAGAIALCCYVVVVGFLIKRRDISALRATLTSLPVWFAAAFGLWAALLR